MDWGAVGAIGETVGGIGVIVTLIYLAIQVRQNTRNIKDNVTSLQVNAYQDLISRIANLNMLQISDPELAELLLKANTDPGSLDDVALNRYTAYLLMLMRHADMAYLQYERGLLDRERFMSVLAPFYGSLMQSRAAMGFVKAMIESESTAFVPAFKREIAALLERIEGEPAAPPRQLMRQAIAALDR